MAAQSPTNHRRRPDRLTLSVAIAGFALALTACGGPGAEASASGAATTAAPSATVTSGPPSATAPATEDDGGSSAAAADLPEVPLESADYSGEPRPVDEVYHRACLEALAGDDEVPETEGTGQDENGELNPTPWSMQKDTALTEGWAYCPVESFGGMAVPASFDVTVDGADGSIEGLTLTDATGRIVGGYRADVQGGAPDAAEILEVIEVTEMPDYSGAGEETAYLRSLIIDAPSGPQLMVDLVSAAEGQDPESLEVWDLGVYDATQRDVIYGAIPLETADDEAIRAAIDLDLHAVLRVMVGSYHPAVQ